MSGASWARRGLLPRSPERCPPPSGRRAGHMGGLTAAGRPRGAARLEDGRAARGEDEQVEVRTWPLLLSGGENVATSSDYRLHVQIDVCRPERMESGPSGPPSGTSARHLSPLLFLCNMFICNITGAAPADFLITGYMYRSMYAGPRGWSRAPSGPPSGASAQHLSPLLFLCNMFICNISEEG